MNNSIVECAGDFAGWDCGDVRRPYYRIRGRRVTAAQAFEVIRRTDWFMQFVLESRAIPDLVENVHFENCWFADNAPHAGWM